MSTDATSAHLVEGVLRGRQLFQARRFSAAEATWRECLRAAFAQGNHAAMFVLSKNLGDVCANHIEAIQFFEYALEVATTCGVLRDPRLRSSIASIAVAMQSLDESIDTCDGCGAIDVRVLPPTTHFNGADSVLCFRCSELALQGKDNPDLDSSAITCATCAQSFPHHALKLDVDDQHYCHACFDAYYGDDDPTPSWDLEEDEDVSDDDGMLCAGCLRADGTLDGGNGLVYCSDCFIAIPSHGLTSVPKEATIPATTSNGRHRDNKPTIPAAAPLQSLESTPLHHPILSTPSSVHAAGEEIPTTAVQKYTKSFLLSLRDSAQSKVVPRGVEMSPVYILGSQQRLKGGPLRGKPTASTIIPAASLATTTATNLEKEDHESNAVVDTTQRSALPMPKAEFARHVLAVDEATVDAVRSILSTRLNE